MNYQETHRDIVEGCQSGNRLAQRKLYEHYARAMYNICFRMLQNEADAEDLLQNSFIDVFTKIKEFRFESSIGAWIKRIVINNCINFLNKKRLQTVEIGERDLPDEGDDTDWEAVQLSAKRIQNAIQTLPQGYRVVLNLYLLEGYDLQEIGEMLNITPSTSKSQYSRAKRKLKEALVGNF